MEQIASYTVPQPAPIEHRKRKAYRQIVMGVLMALAGFYELVTGDTAPKPSDVLRGQ